MLAGGADGGTLDQEQRVKRTFWIAAALVLALAGAGYWYWTRSGETVSVDLIETFRAAEKRSSIDVTAAFATEQQTIQGVTRPVIYMHPTSRLTWRSVPVPEGGRFRAFLGLKEEVWDKGTDGVFFRMAISADDVYTEFLQRQVDPAHKPGDRAWIPIDQDLSKWAGKQVDIIFNTAPSLPGYQPHSMYDFAVIGSPAIVIAKPQS
jgi:hypothetical protein